MSQKCNWKKELRFGRKKVANSFLGKAVEQFAKNRNFLTSLVVFLKSIKKTNWSTVWVTIEIPNFAVANLM